MQVGDRVIANTGSTGIITRQFLFAGGKTRATDRFACWVKLDGCGGREASYWEDHLTLIASNPANEIDLWFDELLAKKPQKKERVTDEIDWEKHKQFMRDL